MPACRTSGESDSIIMAPSRQLAIVAALIAIGLGGWFIQSRGWFGGVGPNNGAGPRVENAVQVDVDTVRTGRMVETREAVGTVKALQSIIVTAKVSGVIEAIDFQEGQMVKVGDILIRMDSDERRADKEKAQAELSRAMAQRDEIAVKLERATTLQKSGSGAGAQVEDLAAQVKTLDGAIASARAAIKAAEARLEDSFVRAPFSGRIGTRNVSLGAYLSPGTQITTLDDLSVAQLDFAVPENLLDRLHIGQVVHATAAAYKGRVFTGAVQIIDTRIDPVTRAVRLTANFANADEALKGGMFLSVTLEVSNNDNATVVPEEAIVNEGMRHIVFVVNKEKRAERRVIIIGQRQRGLAEVLSGLTPGEVFVLRGVQRVRPDSLLDPRPVMAPAESPDTGVVRPAETEKSTAAAEGGKG